MNSVRNEHSGVASGINNAVSRVGGLLAIAIVGIVMLNVFNSRFDEQLSQRGVSIGVQHSLEKERINLGALKAPEQSTKEEAAAIRQSTDEAFVSGFRIVMWIAAGLAILSALSAWVLIEGKKK